jgi:hypothetical protein
MRRIHPLRLQYEMFSNANPLMPTLEPLAEQVRQQRRPVNDDNPFLALQRMVFEQIVAGLDRWRDLNETLAEGLFLSVYGSPLLQAAVGVNPNEEAAFRRAPNSVLHRQLTESRIAELKARISKCDPREALVRTLLYVGMPRDAIDERGFEAIRRLRAIDDGTQRLSLAEFKVMVREQFFMLLLEPQAAVEAIEGLLPQDGAWRGKAFAALRDVLSASGEISGEVALRLARMAKVFGVESGAGTVSVTRRAGSGRLAGPKS